MAYFNLVDEPWIPCLFPDDDVPQDVSLRDVLVRAHDIRELADASPLVTIALHRLILAIIHRIFGPASDSAWGELWRMARFDLDTIDKYLRSWRDRFNLLDEQRPFYQVRDLPDELALTARQLGHEFAVTDDKVVLFDHTTRGNTTPLSLGHAAKLLVAHQAFARSGTITPVPPATKYAASAPLYKGAVVLLRGKTLFETIMLNLVRVNASEPWEHDPSRDRPAWERDQAAEVVLRNPEGYIDYLTWQTRRIRLIVDGRDELNEVVGCVIGVGEQFEHSADQFYWDQMMPFRVNKGAGSPAAYTPLTFDPAKALWRDSQALLIDVPNESVQPRTVKSLRRMVRHMSQDAAPTLSVFGLRYNPKRVASIEFWRREDLPLPLAYLRNPNLVTALGEAIRAAENAGQVVRHSTRGLAEAVLAPGPGLKADRQRVSALADSLAAERAYWPALDVPFRRFMRDLAEAFEDVGQRDAVNGEWADAVQRAATRAFEGASGAVATSARGYRAAAEVAPRFFGQLSGVLAGLRPADANHQEDSP